jgi:hypothetical protein
MADENKDTVATDETESAAAAAEAQPESTVETVRRARAALEQKKAPPANDKTPAAPAKSGGDADDKSKADAEKDAPKEPAKTTEAGFIPDEELVGKDLRNVDLNRVRPELRETVRKLQLAERKKHDQLNKLIADAKAKPETRTATEAREEVDTLGYTDEEIAAILNSKKGREIVQSMLRDEVGDLEALRATSEDRLLAQAVTLAADKFPELAKDEQFYRETVQAIAEDDDLAAAFDENERNPKALARIFRTAAAEVRMRRTDAERETVDKQRKTVEADLEKLRRSKEEANAKPASVAAKAGRKSTATPPEEMATVDMVRKIKAERGYA